MVDNLKFSGWQTISSFFESVIRSVRLYLLMLQSNIVVFYYKLCKQINLLGHTYLLSTINQSWKTKQRKVVTLEKVMTVIIIMYLWNFIKISDKWLWWVWDDIEMTDISLWYDCEMIMRWLWYKFEMAVRWIWDCYEMTLWWLIFSR